MNEVPVPPRRTVIKATLLGQKPDPQSSMIIMMMTTLLFFATGVFLQNYEGVQDKWPASYDLVFDHGQYARLFFALLAHADLQHLLSNSILFFILGYFLYGYFGWVVFPLLTFVLGVISNALTIYSYPPEQQLIGASGMIYAMGGLWLSLYFFIGRNQRLTQRILRFFGVGLMLFAPTSFEQNVSYSAHLYGIILGLVCGTLYFFLRRAHFRKFEVLVVEEPEPEEEIEFAP